MFSSDVMMFTRSLELSAALSTEVGEKVPIDLTTTTPLGARMLHRGFARRGRAAAVTDGNGVQRVV